ncbi:MAG TPA: porphobilinogen synthase [Gemmatimonadales bacterium]|nr:porphobilinogen synthase [Gemmatimonadales bacterium]
MPFDPASITLPECRPRRLRGSATLRRMFRETTLRTNDLVHPVFVREGRGIERAIASMPGHAQRSVDRLDAEADELAALGIPAVLLFGIPDSKDATGTGAWNESGPVPRAIRAVRQRQPGVSIIADVCLCEYTSHGHCGVLDTASGSVRNDETLELLARAAVAYADAGADIVAPSAMMDGQVAAIRSALDAAGHREVLILAYAAKYASAFYAPFRDAAESAPQVGDRRGYQMDPANGREAMLEVALDVAQGADALMVKPAGSYLDIVRRVRERFDLPLAAYQVSGEYAMIRAAAERGWIDERAAALESLVSIRRAGADLVITYFAKAAAEWLRNDE